METGTVPGIGVCFAGIREDDRRALRRFINVRLPVPEPRASEAVLDEPDGATEDFHMEWIPVGPQCSERDIPSTEDALEPSRRERVTEQVGWVGQKAFGLALIGLPVAFVYWLILQLGALIDSLTGGF